MLHLASMGVAVMNVGPVPVGVHNRFMRMGMVVLAHQFAALVRMLVVLVVFVLMRVGDRLVPMEVPVHLSIQKEHSREHDQSRHPILTRGMLSKDQDRKDSANERT